MIKVLIKFALIGICGVGVNMAVYMGLNSLGFNYLIAAGCSFIIAVTYNFFGNLLWTFKGRAEHKSMQEKYISFFIISGINLIVNLLILRVLVGYFNIGETIAQLVAIAAVSGLNFILNYCITFSQQIGKKKGDLVTYATNYHTNV